MKLLRNIAILLFLITGFAHADPFRGQVYGVYPEGILLNSGGLHYLIPTQHATVEVGGVRATWTNITPGQQVHVQVPHHYRTDIRRVHNPYDWKMRHHPRHPHGGPPGLMKKGKPGGPPPGHRGRGRGR